MRFFHVFIEWLLMIAVCAFVIITYPLVSMFDRDDE
jgi:hypothetical protein